MQFEKLVDQILSEGYYTPTGSLGRGDFRSPRQSIERNAGLNAKMGVMVVWARSGKEDYLRNPETRQPVSFRESSRASMVLKMDGLKEAGKISSYRFVDL